MPYHGTGKHLGVRYGTEFCTANAHLLLALCSYQSRLEFYSNNRVGVVFIYMHIFTPTITSCALIINNGNIRTDFRQVTAIYRVYEYIIDRSNR